jgi:hypothetical protein
MLQCVRRATSSPRQRVLTQPRPETDALGAWHHFAHEARSFSLEFSLDEMQREPKNGYFAQLARADAVT